uniref:Retrotransposon gag domain-containing protein n=1 Tax=Cannabis sativa TaxID=3483 RepID=A0A803PAV3_CANSA
MKVVLEGYQHLPHVEETNNHQLGETVEKENNDNNNHPGNHTRCLHEGLGGERKPSSTRSFKTSVGPTGKSQGRGRGNNRSRSATHDTLEVNYRTNGYQKSIDEALQRYVAPKLPEYNEKGDPSEYGLRGPALRWFHNLTSVAINSYQDLILRFQTNFAISVRTAKVDTCLMLIHQGPNEPLEKFINRFNEEYVSILKCTDLVEIKELMQGLLHASELKKAIIVEPGLSLTRALTMARGYVASELEEIWHVEEVSHETSTLGDAFLFEAKDQVPAARSHHRNEGRQAHDRNTRGAVMTSMGQARQLGSQWSDEELPRMTITLTELMRRLRGMKETRWPAKMAIDPEKRDKSQYCAFHREHGHVTYECRQLKIEVNRLVREGFFQDYRTVDSTLHVQQRHDKSQDQSLPPYIKKTVKVISRGSDLSGNSV